MSTAVITVLSTGEAPRPLSFLVAETRRGVESSNDTHQSHKINNQSGGRARGCSGSRSGGGTWPFCRSSSQAARQVGFSPHFVDGAAGLCL